MITHISTYTHINTQTQYTYDIFLAAYLVPLLQSYSVNQVFTKNADKLHERVYTIYCLKEV